ncbi:ribonucleotide reductase of class III anaerobic activating protein [Vibrio astriarenae]|nr:ribonucleotide reductase of class III anaerobic activating protein [Vibrio sp. C7]
MPFTQEAEDRIIADLKDERIKRRGLSYRAVTHFILLISTTFCVS